MAIRRTGAVYAEAAHKVYDVTVEHDGEIKGHDGVILPASFVYSVTPTDPAPLAKLLRDMQAAKPMPIANYTAPAPRAALTVEQKLAKVGLTPEDIRAVTSSR